MNSEPINYYSELMKLRKSTKTLQNTVRNHPKRMPSHTFDESIQIPLPPPPSPPKSFLKTDRKSVSIECEKLPIDRLGLNGNEVSLDEVQRFRLQNPKLYFGSKGRLLNLNIDGDKDQRLAFADDNKYITGNFRVNNRYFPEKVPENKKLPMNFSAEERGPVKISIPIKYAATDNAVLLKQEPVYQDSLSIKSYVNKNFIPLTKRKNYTYNINSSFSLHREIQQLINENKNPKPYE